ncbi:hypothetical protein [Haloferax volcanii]|uniref:Uncharacterized protein n=3 Tax=Haloferax volcanii TaxID=2246 RepID=A0A384KEF6_HALVD|nr:hypothetical protein [Haloferax volcanii]ADE03858.1 uncharacterized protein HVO_1278 [Haloferax volcanii DS2]ELY28036.1 hypothetical protein C498_12353 [Haloferax volcanii DS2]MBS8117718.1 hypothetical protein [Haloferax volcanii]MBS8122730.1 hypothetical protein [Haloferax volcanii]MBS8126598.1 hypothetical protein [Haloferax volcanii]
MVRDTAHRLAEYLSRRIGDGLRTVVIAADGGYELEYIRDDLSERYTERTLTAAVTDLQVETSFSSPSSDSSPAGERRAVVYYYENAFVLQFPFSEAEQIIISIGTGFGTDLLRFIEDCRRIVDREN